MRRALIVAFALAASALSVPPVGAISYGSADGNGHPYVGAVVAEWREEGQKDLFCSGTLIDEDVFLTAAHCTEYLRSIGIAPDDVWITFEANFDKRSRLIGGTYYSHPQFGHDQSDPKDIAVIVLDRSVAIAPARLPTASLLSEMKAAHTIDDAYYTAVGYGTVRDTRTGGFDNIEENSERRAARQTYAALTDSWLKFSMNDATGDAGTCYGDSGGPHFLADSNLLVSLTVTGDAVCKASDVTYRVDTPVARNFLDDFVAVP